MDITILAPVIESVGPYLIEFAVTVILGLLFPALRGVLNEAKGKFGAERVQRLSDDLGAAIRRGVAKAVAQAPAGHSNETIRDMVANYIEQTKGDALKGLGATRDQLLGRIESEMATGMDWLIDTIKAKK